MIVDERLVTYINSLDTGNTRILDLDCIEAELVNIKNKHGKTVAYISICMAEYWKIEGDELQDLAMCALLHDNALTQYISEELKNDSVINCKKDLSEKKTNLHCI